MTSGQRDDFPFPTHLLAERPVAEAEVELRCDFHDCDPMGVLWHGRHLAYCERARHRLGDRVGLGLARLGEWRLHAPVTRSQVVHHRPVRAGDAVVVQVALYPSRHPRLYHRYRLAVDGDLATTAETEQVLTDHAFNLVLRRPPELAALFGD